MRGYGHGLGRVARFKVAKEGVKRAFGSLAGATVRLCRLCREMREELDPEHQIRVGGMYDMAILNGLPCLCLLVVDVGLLVWYCTAWHGMA